MEITNVKVYPVGKGGAFIGYADVTLDDCVALRGLKVVKNKKGTYVAIYPERKQTKRDKKLNRTVNYFHPTNKEMRKMLDDAVAKAVNETLANIKDATTETEVSDKEDLFS